MEFCLRIPRSVGFSEYIELEPDRLPNLYKKYVEMYKRKTLFFVDYLGRAMIA